MTYYNVIMVNIIKENSCCIIGHRTIKDLDIVENRIVAELKNLIENKNVSTFKFGYFGEFNDLCLKIVNELKNEYSEIKTVFYSLNNEIAFTYQEREEYLRKSGKNNKTFKYKCFDEIIYLKDIDETKFKLAYVLRNKNLIEQSDFCLIYYRDEYKLPNQRNSGTKIAYEYACSKNKKIIII